MHSLLLASLDVQLTECSSHSLLLPPAEENKTLTSKTVLSCSTQYHCKDQSRAVGVFGSYSICKEGEECVILNCDSNQMSVSENNYTHGNLSA